MLGNKWLRLGLCLFMLPLSLVIGMPGAAVAGTTETLRFDLTSFLGEVPAAGEAVDVECVLGVGTTVTPSGALAVVSPSSYCAGGPDTSPLSCQVAEPGCGTYELKFSGIGGLCGSGYLAQEPMNNEWYDTFGTGVYVLGQVPLTAGCDPTEVCLVYNNGGSGPARESCVSSTLDAVIPADPLAPCAKGSVAAPPRSEPPNYPAMPYSEPPPQNSSHAGWWDHTHASMATDPDPAAAGAWIEYVVHKNTVAATNMTTWDGIAVQIVPVPRATGAGVTLPADPFRTQTQGINTPEFILAAIQDDQIVGRGVFWASGVTGSGTKRAIRRGSTSTDGLYGITNTVSCAWYWGDRIADDPTSDSDLPIGSVVVAPPSETGEPPVVEPPVPPPVPDDEPSFWGAILAILNAIKNAISGLLGAIKGIAASILAGLQGLFVPGAGVLSGEVEELGDAWDNTSPAKYLGALEGFTIGDGVSGCSGMPLNITLPGGVQVSESLGDACGGSMASVAGLVRAALSAVVVVGGCFACVRAVGSGLGWSPGIGRVE